MFIFLLLISNCIFSMETATSVVVSDSTVSSSSSTNFASPEEKDDLYARAIYMVYPMGYDHICDQFKPYLDDVINKTDHSSPIIDEELNESNVTILRRLRSGDIDNRHEGHIKRLVMQATSAAFEDQRSKLEKERLKVIEKQEDVDSKFSKQEASFIALGCSVLSAIVSVLSSKYS